MTQKNTKGRVILTYGRSLMALTAAHSLGSRGIEIIGSDDVDMTVLQYSKYCSDYFTHAPYEKDEAQYLNDLEQNVRKFKPDDDRPYVLMPMFRDAKILAKHKERFEGLITVATPDFETIDKIAPKNIFADTCEDLNLPVPKTYQPQSANDLDSLRDEIDFPTLVKTPDGVGGRGIKKVDNFEELQKEFKASKQEFGTPPLIQDVIEGRDYCLTAICDKGEIIASMAYKNLYQYPRDTGAGIMRETIDDAPFLKPAKKLAKALNWHGIAQIDYRWSGNEGDQAYLIESNPRFWAGLFHSVESGIDYPWLLYQLMGHGEITDMEKAIIGARTKVPGIWSIPAIQDLVDNSTDFEKIKTAFTDIWNNEKDLSWKEKFSSFQTSIKQSFDNNKFDETFQDIKDKNSTAISEYDFSEDPKSSLGILFIISSLLKHGELPPEVKK